LSYKNTIGQMYEEDVSKNLEIFKKWTDGRTVREISEETGYPISTVGYYVHKFNRKAQKGEPMDFTQVPKADKVTLALNASIKLNAFQIMKNYMDSGDYIGLYYFLMDVKLIKELGRDLILTKDEYNSSIGVLIESIKAASSDKPNNNNLSGKSARSKGISLDEAIRSMVPDY